MKLTSNCFLSTAYVWLLLSASFATASEQPLAIENSRSPDGKIEIWIKPDSNDEGEAAGMAQIRKVKTGKILGTFEWSGFGVHADSNAFEVLWRQDCRCFAIKWEETRGWMTGAVYACNTKGGWTCVKLPSDEYVAWIKKVSGVSEFSSGKGFDTPEKWLADGQLLLEFGTRDLGDYSEVTYQVLLRITDSEKHPLSKARIISINLKPRT